MVSEVGSCPHQKLNYLKKIISDDLMPKSVRKRKGFRPKKLVFAGSSNTVKLEDLIEFIIKPNNKSKPGASALRCRNNNYCTQIAPPDRDTLYLLFL